MEEKNNTITNFIQSPKGLTIIVICVVILLAVYILLSSQTGIPSTTSEKPTPSMENGFQNTNQNNRPPSSTVYPTTDPATKTSQLSFEKQGSWVNLVLDTGSTPVSGVQISVSYNPAIMSHIQISPGTFFTAPIVLQNQIDTTQGIISYAIAIPPGEQQKTGKGTIATISYQLAPGQTTSMTFLPDTKITSVGINDSVMRAAEPVNLP